MEAMEMQNKYFGDKHDFYKYFFLKHISNYYSLGIHWCLISDEEKTNDGKKSLSKIEENKEMILYKMLNNAEKNIKTIKCYFPKKTKYFDEIHKCFYRDFIYGKNAIKKLNSQDVIFFDPDNGIEVSSTKNSNKFKFITYKLLSEFWNMGKTLIIYQHTDRNKKSIDEKINNLCDLLKCNKIKNILIVKRGNVKYICIINKKHFDLRDIIADFLCKNKEYEKYI
jgi:hypothetical protein